MTRERNVWMVPAALLALMNTPAQAASVSANLPQMLASFDTESERPPLKMPAKTVKSASLPDDPVRGLRTEAHAAQRARQPDAAAEAWQRLLRVRPYDAEALAAMTRHHAENKEMVLARRYFVRLKQANDRYAALPELERLVGLAESVAPVASDKPIVAQLVSPTPAQIVAMPAAAPVAPAGPSPWEILNRATKLREQDQPEPAQALISALLRRDSSRDASHAAALFYAADKHWESAWSALERIAPAARNVPIRALLREVNAQLRLAEAKRLAEAGQAETFSQTMRETEQLATGLPALTGEVASVWMQQGHADLAVAYLEKNRPLDSGLTVLYGWALFNARQEARLAQFLAEADLGGLSAEQRNQLDEIRKYAAARQAAAPQQAEEDEDLPLPDNEMPSTAVTGQALAAKGEANYPDVEAGYVVRTKHGAPGLGAVHERELPLAYHLPLEGEHAELVFKATPVALDAGALPLATVDQFGRNNAALPAAATGNYPLSARGIGFSLGYQSPRVAADFGISPLGFLFSTPVGGLRWNDSVLGSNLALEVSRRSVTDSLLSYAGVVDNVSGAAWGGVTRNGGQAALYRPLAGALAGYASAGSYVYQGRNVASNTSQHLIAALIYDLERTDEREVSVALRANSNHYSKNLSYFYWGHGGYYSPQREFGLALPVHFAGRSERLAYKLDIVLSRTNSTESVTPVYPTSAILQANAALPAFRPLDAAGLNPQPINRSGLGGFKIDWVLEYKLSPQVVLGNRFGFDGSSTFHQMTNMLFVRYIFDPRGERLALPPNPTKPYYLTTQGGVGLN